MMAGLLLILSVSVPSVSNGQKKKASVKEYLQKPPAAMKNNFLLKYRMTAVYTNRDLYGNFMGKIKVSGEYTRGLENGTVIWNNIYISASNNFADPFPAGTKQEYMENFTYVPSDKMLETGAFNDFPATTTSVFAKNLVWDMMTIEGFAWQYTDSLKLNKVYRVPDASGGFDMAGIGTYAHAEIQLSRTGISEMNGEFCTLIEYRAIDNKLELAMPGFSSKGTEQYWGTIWVSLKTGAIEYAVMYGGTAQEIYATGMPNKFIVKTIRELWVDKIK
jgi:hypothetical protein